MERSFRPAVRPELAAYGEASGSLRIDAELFRRGVGAGRAGKAVWPTVWLEAAGLHRAIGTARACPRAGRVHGRSDSEEESERLVDRA